MVDLVPKYFLAKDGRSLGLHVARWDEHHRRRRAVLPARASSWDYAPLIDMIRPAIPFREFRYLGITAHEWLERMRSRGDPDYPAAVSWFLHRVGRVRRHLDLRPRVPDNEYAVVLADIPVVPVLPHMIERFGPKQVAEAEWRSMLLGLCNRGLRMEELERSGLLGALDYFEAFWRRVGYAHTVPKRDILDWISLDHLRLRLVVECRHDFATAAGWRACCEVLWMRQGRRRRGAIGNGRHEIRVVRFRHRTFGWSLVRHTLFPDLLRDREDRWLILDERGDAVLPRKGAPMAEVEDAMAAAECAMADRFRQWRRGIESQQWRAYSLPGGDGYRELLVQLHDWPNNYQPRHYRTRNVLIHLRTSIRATSDGRRMLYLDEVQSDWQADVHADARGIHRSVGNSPVPPAPFAKEWPLLALKIALWWAQRQGLDGLAWSTADIQRARWGGRGPPESLYRTELPDAAAQLARLLALDTSPATLKLRGNDRYVDRCPKGWIVCGRDGVPFTRPFRHREQAERFADETATFLAVDVPCLWFDGLQTIRQIPLFGLGSVDTWFGDKAATRQSSKPSEKILPVVG